MQEPNDENDLDTVAAALEALDADDLDRAERLTAELDEPAAEPAVPTSPVPDPDPPAGYE